MSALSMHLAGGTPVIAALGLLAFAVALVVWTYRRNRDRLSRWQLLGLGALRVALMTLLLCGLVEPVLSYRSSPAEEAPVLFLVDTSKSMSLEDAVWRGRPDAQTRLEAALAPWLGPERLARTLERRFAVRYFAFDAGTRPIETASGLANLPPSGEMTLIGEALSSAAAQAGTEELSGVILLTDGVDQSSIEPVDCVRRLGAPVYVVAVGDVRATYTDKPDLAVADVSGARFMAKGVENQLVVRVNQRGFTGAAASVEVRDENAPLTTEEVELRQPSVEVRMGLMPDRVGKQVFEVVAPALEGEEVVENNRRSFTAIVEENRLAVLFVEGTPRWEYKFLKRALEWDPGVAFTGFIHGASGLFLRQGEKVGTGVLPVSREEFAQFRVIILGDLPPSALSTVQLEALKEAVLEDGRGLIFIPGPRALEGGGFGATPLADVLPALPAYAAPSAAETGFVPQLTADGREHPIFAGLGGMLASGGDFELPGCMALDVPSAGATVLAYHPFEHHGVQLRPVFVCQASGQGRCLVAGVDSTWRWRMSAGTDAARSFHARFWGQAVRWLAGEDEESEGESSFTAYASRDYYDAGQEAILLARLRREKGAAGEVRVSAEIHGPAGDTLTTPLEFVPESGGLYRARLEFSTPGRYTAEVAARLEEQIVAEDTVQFFMGRPYQEFDRVAMNERLLRSLAFESGGAFHTPEDAQAIPDELVAEAAQRAAFVEKKFARSPLVYLLIVACASVEWYLRKRRGLM
ncbi:MAG: hypothetical protein JXR94_24530 [Candidatus Hydrogenedentes bacterium]|nr:hypothetical protein [Candidatus Hydrogenedentota bacterium]